MKHNTPNYGWEVPDSQEPLREGGGAIRTLGDSIDRDMALVVWPSTANLLTVAKSNADIGGLLSPFDLGQKVTTDNGASRRLVAGGASFTPGVLGAQITVPTASSIHSVVAVAVGQATAASGSKVWWTPSLWWPPSGGVFGVVPTTGRSPIGGVACHMHYLALVA